MSTGAENTFMRAMGTAEAVSARLPRAAAFNTWAFGTGAAFTTYTAALVAADNVYSAAVQAAANTAGTIGISLPNMPPASQVPVVTLGNVGTGGPPTNSMSTTFGSTA